MKSNHIPKLLLTAFLFASPACYAGLAEGLAAYEHKDWSSAYTELMPLAEKGNAVAQNKIGNLYSAGNGVTQDYQEALKWYKKSAGQGNASAQNNIGSVYQNGEGVEQNDKEAMKWYRKSEKQGNATAKQNIAEMNKPKPVYIEPAYVEPEETEVERERKIEENRAYGCAMANSGCNTNMYGGKY